MTLLPPKSAVLSAVLMLSGPIRARMPMLALAAPTHSGHSALPWSLFLTFGRGFESDEDLWAPALGSRLVTVVAGVRPRAEKS